jgi:ferredoxin
MNRMHPSTRAFWRANRKSENPSLFNFLHGYLYGRWTYFYIAMGTGRHPLAKRLAPLLNWIGGLIVDNAGGSSTPALKMEDTYHGKVVPLAAAKQLVSIKEDISLKNLEHVIPYSLARDIVLENPDHIVALDCPCRMASQHPCLPLDVCLIVGEPFASFVTGHHPNHSRSITSQEAQEILQAEDKRGHVHHAFFKDAMAGRFYAICNCCACCCGAMQAQRSGTPMLASSGYLARVEASECISCRRCEKACQFNAIRIDGFAVIDSDMCMGCGVCVAQCKPGAIRLERAAEKGIPLEIEALLAAAPIQ